MGSDPFDIRLSVVGDIEFANYTNYTNFVRERIAHAFLLTPDELRAEMGLPALSEPVAIGRVDAEWNF